MKKGNKKRRMQKLSIKIVLMLFVILAMVFCILRLIIFFIQLAGVEFDSANAENWLFVFFPLIVGMSIIIVFAYAINKTIVARISKLKDATARVANGDLSISLDVKGRDELSELTESFNAMSAELRANEYLSKDFVRNVSHEFRTPISAIRAYGELIDTEADAETISRAALKECAEIIVRESDRLTALSKSVLQLSLIGSTTIIKKDESFKPAEQIRDVLRLMQTKWSEKNIILDLTLEEVIVTSNEQMLFQVWQNLICNAIKFSNAGGTIKIVLARHYEQGLYFEIADNGIGIPDEDKGEIFMQFYMADKSRNTEGSGLGLSIVKKIVEKLGGQISFESQINKGTKFILTV